METAIETELSARLAAIVLRTSRRLRRSSALPEASRPVVAALRTLGRHGPMTPSEIATHEEIKRPTATTLIARMEELGFASREADPSDRRSCRVSLTPQGKELVSSLRRHHDEYFSRSLERLTAQERATLISATELLERMLEQDEQR